MAYFDDLTGMTYDQLLKEFEAQKAAGTYKGGPLIASDGQHYNVSMPSIDEFSGFNQAITFDRGTNNGNNNVSYSPDNQSGYVYKDDDSFGGFLANGLKYVGAPMLAAYGLSGLLGGAGTGAASTAAGSAGGLSAADVAGMGFSDGAYLGAADGFGSGALASGSAGLGGAGQIGALGGDAAYGDLLSQSMELGLPQVAGDAAVNAQLAQGILNPANLATGVGVGAGAGATKGLLDTVSEFLPQLGGAKGLLTAAGGLLAAGSAKDGTTTQTKEPWAPMQPYLLDNANNIKNWYAQNGNGGVEANRLAAQIPAFNQQQAQAGQGLLSMANQYAKRKGL